MTEATTTDTTATEISKLFVSYDPERHGFSAKAVIKEELSGLSEAYLKFTDPSNRQIYFTFSPSNKIDENEYETFAQLDPYYAAGTFDLNYAYANDKAGNTSSNHNIELVGAVIVPENILKRGSSVYELLRDGQEITLKSSRGKTYSDASSGFWDAVQAVETATGFDVLLEGTGPRAGRFLVWGADDAGAITERSRWRTGDQMFKLGYEDVFGRDFNGDSFIGDLPVESLA